MSITIHGTIERNDGTVTVVVEGETPSTVSEEYNQTVSGILQDQPEEPA